MTQEQKTKLLLDYIHKYATGTFYASFLARSINYHYGIQVDYHEFSNILDRLHTAGELKHNGFTGEGQSIYTWKRGE